MRLLSIFLAVACLLPNAAVAGKDGKLAEARSSYSYVIGQVGRTSDKGKKASAIMAEIRRAHKSMDRGAFYSFVGKKDAEMLALTK